MEAMRPSTKRRIITGPEDNETKAPGPGAAGPHSPIAVSHSKPTVRRTATVTAACEPAAAPPLPSWFTAFDLATNTRFTRTPDRARRPAGEIIDVSHAEVTANVGSGMATAAPEADDEPFDADDAWDQSPEIDAFDDDRDDDEDDTLSLDADTSTQDDGEPTQLLANDEDEDDVASFVASLSGPPRLPFLGYGEVMLDARLTWHPMREIRRRPEPARVQRRETEAAPVVTRRRNVAAAETARRAVEGEFCLPSLELLAEATVAEPPYEASAEYLDRSSVTLQQTLHDFGVRGEVIDANPGPVVTLYEFEPAPGTKSSRVIGLSNDIARSMSAVSARVAVVPGRNAIGIELPNTTRETVYLRELIETQDFSHSKHRLAVALGKNIGGEPIIADLARMPHLLVAGTTGSGKSVAINTMILSLLYMHKPEQCRLIMVDPKMLELSVYDGIPHLLTPVVTDPKKAVIALKWAVREMEERYKKMSKLSVRNIDGFNQRVEEASARGEVITRTVQTGFDRNTGEAIYEDEIMDLEPLPYIVVIVDEMADLMMVAGKDIEGAIQRLAQMARAAGIHLIMATQRPSVDVITGTIKANFPTRISFQVTSKIDSRTILGEMGAEQLLGQGDMLYMAGGGRITRVHGPFVSDGEVEKVVAHLKAQGRPEYLDSVTKDDEEPCDLPDETDDEIGEADGDVEGDDPYDQAIAVVMRDRKASTSYIQRRLGIGYNRAASIMERMEKEGIVGPANHAGKRAIHANEPRHAAEI
jgi:S-DNA-T family DNA segregation ATPase FtsK/SpoIIIE